MLKSLGLWKTTYEDPVMFKEKEQKFRLDTEGDSAGLHRVDEKDTLTADAAPPTGKDLAVLKHGGSRLSYSAPGLGNSGSSSQLGRGSGLHRRSSAGSVSEQVRHIKYSLYYINLFILRSIFHVIHQFLYAEIKFDFSFM
jgi:hypothetical protein